MGPGGIEARVVGRKVSLQDSLLKGSLLGPLTAHLVLRPLLRGQNGSSDRVIGCWANAEVGQIPGMVPRTGCRGLQPLPQLPSHPE